MKNIFYIYLLLISASLGAMQPKTSQKPLFSKQEIAGVALVAVPMIHTALTTTCAIVAPQLTTGMVAIGAMKNASMTMGTALILDANQKK